MTAAAERKTDPRIPRLRRVAYLLFSLLSAATLVGPLAIFIVGRGGQRPTWPPDRPIESWTFWGVTIAYSALLLTTLASCRRLLRALTDHGPADPGSRKAL